VSASLEKYAGQLAPEIVEYLARAEELYFAMALSGFS